MWVNPCAQDILFSPTGICVQILFWIQRKLNYSFLGKKLPAVQESNVIYNNGVFFSCHGLQQKTGTWNSGSGLAVPEFAAKQLHLGCDSHPVQGRGPGKVHSATVSKPTMVHLPKCEWDWGSKYMRRLVNHESASAKSDSQKIITLFPHSFAKMTGITSVIKNIFFSIYFSHFLLL